MDKFNGPRKPHQKKKRKRPMLSNDDTNSTAGALRYRIRSQKKLLERATSMPADLRQEKEREISSLETRLQTLLEQRKRSHTVGKYHMVRFVERQKAERAIKKWSKLEQTIETAARLREAEIDLAYTQNAPLGEKYAGLYAGDKAEEDLSHANTAEEALDIIRQGKPVLWTLIEQAMGDGSIEQVRAGTHAGLSARGLDPGGDEEMMMLDNDDDNEVQADEEPDPMTIARKKKSRGDFYQPNLYKPGETRQGTKRKTLKEVQKAMKDEEEEEEALPPRIKYPRAARAAGEELTRQQHIEKQNGRKQRKQAKTRQLPIEEQNKRNQREQAKKQRRWARRAEESEFNGALGSLSLGALPHRDKKDGNANVNTHVNVNGVGIGKGKGVANAQEDAELSDGGFFEM